MTMSNCLKNKIARSQFAALPNVLRLILLHSLRNEFEKLGTLIGVVGMWYSRPISSGSTQTQETSASGLASRKNSKKDSKDASLPKLPPPNIPKRQIFFGLVRARTTPSELRSKASATAGGKRAS